MVAFIQLFFVSMMFLIVRKRSAAWSKAWIFLTTIPLAIAMIVPLVVVALMPDLGLAAVSVAIISVVALVALFIQGAGWLLGLVISKNNCSIKSIAIVSAIAIILMGGTAFSPIGTISNDGVFGYLSSLLLTLAYVADVILRGHMLNILARRKAGTLDEPIVYPLEALIGIGNKAQVD